MNLIPKFEHDCSECVFLGHFQKSDLYVCRGTVIARFSDEPRDYASGIVFATPTGSTELYMALRRATEIGIDPMRFDETVARSIRG